MAQTALVLAVLVGGCASVSPGPQALAGAEWRLVAFRAPDGATLSPPDGAAYEMTLRDDGYVAMKLDCSTAAGTWSATPADAEHGAFRFELAAMHRVYCRPGMLETRIVHATETARAYALHGDVMELWTNAGTYAWRRVGPQRS
jgi:hypothetical protein